MFSPLFFMVFLLFFMVKPCKSHQKGRTLLYSNEGTTSPFNLQSQKSTAMTTQEFKQLAAKKLLKLSTKDLKVEVEKLYMKIHQLDSASRMVLFVAYDVLENKMGEDAYDEYLEELQQKLYA